MLGDSRCWYGRTTGKSRTTETRPTTTAKKCAQRKPRANGSAVHVQTKSKGQKGAVSTAVPLFTLGEFRHPAAVLYKTKTPNATTKSSCKSAWKTLKPTIKKNDHHQEPPPISSTLRENKLVVRKPGRSLRADKTSMQTSPRTGGHDGRGATHAYCTLVRQDVSPLIRARNAQRDGPIVSVSGEALSCLAQRSSSLVAGRKRGRRAG